MHKLLKALKASEDTFKDKLVKPLATVIKVLKLDPDKVMLDFDVRYYPYNGFVGVDITNDKPISHTMVNDVTVGNRVIIRQSAFAQNGEEGKIEVNHNIVLLLTKEEYETLRINRQVNDDGTTGQKG